MHLDDLLIKTFDDGGSDLIITTGIPPVIRIDGRLEKVAGNPLTPQDTQKMLYDILTESQRNTFEKEHELDFSYEIPNICRFRGNVFLQNYGMAGVFRVVPTKIKTFEELNLPPVIAELARCKKGLVLVTGPTGSGKSTTLAAMIDLINEETSSHIITIENPIEFIHKHKKSVINQREVGVHTFSFANALKSALRENPDVILIGELRDYETISEAVTAAETGHLVLGTLHANSAIKTIDRIVDVFPPHQQEQIRTQLAESLQGVIAQQLIPTKSGIGRVVALEIMVATPAVRNLIREGKTYQIESIIQTSGEIGMQTMDASLKALVAKGLITGQEAYRRADNKKYFEQYAR